MQKRDILLNALITAVAGVGGLLVLTFGQSYGILSNREQGLGMLVCAVGLAALMTFLAKRTIRKSRLADQETQAAQTDLIGKPPRRRPLLLKARIGFLVAAVAIGIAVGIRQHDVMPALVGGAIALLGIYLKLQPLRRTNKPD